MLQVMYEYRDRISLLLQINETSAANKKFYPEFLIYL